MMSSSRYSIPALHIKTFRHLSGLKTKEFGGPGHNQLLFDDSDHQLRLQFSTTQAHTQLNLGHLIHQADNYRGAFRGEGFELRTDAHGTVRAARGLLLTTYRLTPAEPAFDNAPGQALLTQARHLAQTLNQATTTHNTVGLASHQGSHAPGQSRLSDQAAPLSALHTAASGLDDSQLPASRAPLLTLTAKGGLGLTAGHALHLTSGDTLSLQSGQHTGFTVGGHYRLHSGQAIGILAGAIKAGSGLNLIAAQGPVTLQAQSGPLKLQGKQNLTVASARSRLDLAAAKAITVTIASGASLTLQGGRVDLKCPGTLSLLAGKRNFVAPAGMSYALPKMPRGPLSLPPDVPVKFDIRITDMPGPAGVPIPYMPWRIVRAPDANNALAVDKPILGGESNAEGKVMLSNADEEILKNAYNISPSQLWLVYAGQVQEFMITRTVDNWTDQQKLYHALDAMGYSDQLYMSDDTLVDDFQGAIARTENRANSGQAMIKKTKGNV